MLFIFGEPGFIIANATSQTICFYNSYLLEVPLEHNTLIVIGNSNINSIKAIV